MAKKKLLITASTFPRWEGDTEPRFVLDYAKAMREYYDVTVLAPAAVGAKCSETLEGVNVIRYNYFPIKRLQTLCYPGAIIPRIKEKKSRALLVPFLLLSLWCKLLFIVGQYDVVHANWLIPQGVIQSFFKVPYIVTGHGGDVGSLNAGIVKRLKIRCLKRAKAVISVSYHLKDRILELSPDIDVKVVPMGVDTSKFDRNNRVPDYYGQGDKKVILFVGRLAEKKGVTYLIEAMKNVDALLYIVGDGPLREELMKQAEGMRDKVFFPGSKPHTELKKMYASADLFAAPSVTAANGDREGVPTVIMEAMASGLPIVSTYHSGIPDIVSDGVNGFLCEEKNVEELTERINRILADGELHSRFSEASVKLAQDLDYVNIAKRYEEILCDGSVGG